MDRSQPAKPSIGQRQAPHRRQRAQRLARYAHLPRGGELRPFDRKVNQERQGNRYVYSGRRLVDMQAKERDRRKD